MEYERRKPAKELKVRKAIYEVREKMRLVMPSNPADTSRIFTFFNLNKKVGSLLMRADACLNIGPAEGFDYILSAQEDVEEAEYQMEYILERIAAYKRDNPLL